MAADETFTEFAPAKLNLFLEVTGRRDDGYHLLDSLVVFADIGDTVMAHPSDTISLIYEGPFASALPPPTDNLVIRAAEALRSHFNIDPGAALTLTKSLPVASGIGGGSSDAAAALRACARLWDIDLDTPKMRELALSLGADIPVCLAGRACVMRGIGEDLRPLVHIPPLVGVLVNPGQPIETATVFNARTGDFSGARNWPDASYSPADFISALSDRRNDLEPAAATVHPIVKDVLTALHATGAELSRMSGSGATCFALFIDAEARDAAVGRLRSAHPNWWVQPFMVDT